MDLPQKATVSGPKEPISVEQSRAQRIERQQARFRDRGGIFVPSSRNTLADILLGRKARTATPSPRKRKAVKARTQVQSPSKRKNKLPEVSSANVRATSEKKPSRKKSQQRKDNLGNSEPQVEIVQKEVKKPGRPKKSASSRRRQQKKCAKDMVQNVGECLDPEDVTPEASSSKRPLKPSKSHVHKTVKHREPELTDKAEQLPQSKGANNVTMSCGREVRPRKRGKGESSSSKDIVPTLTKDDKPVKNSVLHRDCGIDKLSLDPTSKFLANDAPNAIEIKPSDNFMESHNQTSRTPTDPGGGVKRRGKDKEREKILSATSALDNIDRVDDTRVLRISKRKATARSNHLGTEAQSRKRPKLSSSEDKQTNGKKRDKGTNSGKHGKDELREASSLVTQDHGADVIRKSKRFKPGLEHNESAKFRRLETDPKMPRLPEKKRERTLPEHDATIRPNILKAKLRGPRKSVLVRAKRPLSPIVDDEPDPLNLFQLR